jgi:hypothetical protein
MSVRHTVGAMLAGALVASAVPSTAATTSQLVNRALSVGKANSAKIAGLNKRLKKLQTAKITTVRLKNGAVTSAKIADGTVGTGDLADSSVTGAKIADGQVGGADLGDGQVASADLSDGGVGTADLADNSVTGGKVNDQSLGQGDLGPNAVGGDELAANSVQQDEVVDRSLLGRDLHQASARTFKYDFGSVPGTGCTRLAVTAAETNGATNGIRAGDLAFVMNDWPDTEDALSFEPYVQDTANQLRIALCNHSNQPVNPVEDTFSFLVITP